MPGTGKHSSAPTIKPTPAQRNRAARRANRRARERRFVRMQERMDELRGQVNLGNLEPVHPRDHYWHERGVAGQPFTLQPPNGGGSYYARYRAMYEAGARRKGVAGS